VSCSAHVKIASRIVPYRKRCAMIPVAGQLTHGPTFRMLEVTLQQLGEESAVYEWCVVDWLQGWTWRWQILSRGMKTVDLHHRRWHVQRVSTAPRRLLLKQVLCMQTRPVTCNHTCNENLFSFFVGSARLVCGAGSMKGRVSVRLSVPAWAHSSKPAAADLLLWAQRGGIDRLLQQRRAAAECGQCHVVSVRR